MTSPSKRRMSLPMVIYGIVTTLVVVSALVISVQRASAEEDISASMTLIAPAGAGGGWDSFVREQQQVLRQNNIVGNVRVLNIPGAGGTIGLAKLTTMEGTGDTLMATGSAMTGGIALNDSPVAYEDVTPLARLTEDYDVIIVPADSPHNTINDLFAEWTKNPSKHPWTGGSAGSLDHLVVADLALAAGIKPSKLTYIPKSGGGEAIQALLNGTASYASTGYNEVSDQILAGRVKALAVTSPERLPGVNIPTLQEQGVDVVKANWRGMIAPPGITPEVYKQQLEILRTMHNTEDWQEVLKRNAWSDAWLAGDEFQEFLKEDMADTSALLKELGL